MHSDQEPVGAANTCWLALRVMVRGRAARLAVHGTAWAPLSRTVLAGGMSRVHLPDAGRHDRPASRPSTSPCSPQVLQAPHDGECSSFIDRDAEQLVAFPYGQIAGVTIFRDA